MAQGGWAGAAHVLLFLACAWLCCACVANARPVPAGVDVLSRPRGRGSVRGVELDSGLDGIIVSAYTKLKTRVSASEVQSFSPKIGEILTRIDGVDSDRQAENHSISGIQGQKWKRTSRKIAEWVFHACVVVLAVCVMYYTISGICACCIALDILAEIWRILGGWQGFSYFARIEREVVETDPEPLPLLRSAAEEP